ncbi:MAG: phosphoribosyltransferase [Patescibacteria group bacterium]|nr:phosphoribosyltransferase [Patescibacteria group bacterium]
MQDQDLLKEALKKYHKENYYVQTWDEYYEELGTLTKKVVDHVRKNKITVDAVVPILRGGNIPGTVLAYTLNLLTILPVQYKYFFVKDKCELRRISGINKKLVLKENPTLLLVEGNHCYGNQAKYAAKDLKTAFPKSRIIYAASNMDYKYQDVVKDAEVSFYGNLTNCCKELSDEECKKLGIQYKKDLLFPWENIEEEWEIVELKQHKYANLDKIMASSPLVAEFSLS